MGLTNEGGELEIKKIPIEVSIRKLGNYDTTLIISKQKNYYLEEKSVFLDELIVQPSTSKSNLKLLQQFILKNLPLYERNTNMDKRKNEYYYTSHRITHQPSKVEYGLNATIFIDPLKKEYNNLFYCDVEYFPDVEVFKEIAKPKVGNRLKQFATLNCLENEQYYIKKILKGKIKNVNLEVTDSIFRFNFKSKDLLLTERCISYEFNADSIITNITFGVPEGVNNYRGSVRWVDNYVKFQYKYDEVIKLEKVEIFERQKSDQQIIEHLINIKRVYLDDCIPVGKVTLQPFDEEQKLNKKYFQ